jgi:putative ABC transport system ATP-binding protein
MKRAIIKVDNVIKIYKDIRIETVALRGLNAEFYPGEISLIIGPSGCGKTTLLNAIGGLTQITSGDILINEKSIKTFTETELDVLRLKQIGFIYQFFNLIPELTAEENILLPLEVSSIKNNEAKLRVTELLNLVGMENRKKHYPGELSGGEQQKIAIATALATSPQIILCDEPTGELDSTSKQNIMRIFKEIIKKYPDKCIIIVSHDPEMRYIADRIFQIRDGKISFMTENTAEDKMTFDQLLQEDSLKQVRNKELQYELQETIYYLQKKLENINKK